MSETPKFELLTPMIPAGGDVGKAVAFYENLGFETVFQIETMAIVMRDAAQIFLQQNDDRQLAENTALRIRTTEVASLYEDYKAKGVVHPNGALKQTPWNTREFAVLDPAGVCITFYQEVEGGSYADSPH